MSANDTVPVVGVPLGALMRGFSLAAVAGILSASNNLLQLRVDKEDGFQTYVISTRDLGVNQCGVQKSFEELSSMFRAPRKPLVLPFQILRIEKSGVLCHKE